MRSLTIAVALALFERGLVTATFYNFLASEPFSERVEDSISMRPIELSPLQVAPSVRVATAHETSLKDATDFWLGDDGTVTSFLYLSHPEPHTVKLHAGFNAAGATGPYAPIYFAEKTVKAEDTLTVVQERTIMHAKGFGAERIKNIEPGVSWLRYEDDWNQFAFCPSPFGDTVVAGGEPIKNKDGKVMILSVLQKGFPQSVSASASSGCIPTHVFASDREARELPATSPQDDQ